MHKVLVTGACLFALAACGQTAAPAAQPPTSSADQMTDMSAPPANGGGDTAPVSTNEVAIKDFAFAPGTVTVKVGTTVTWKNNDQDPHTVTSTGSGGPLKSPTLQTNDTYKYTFTQAGKFDYLCTIHPFMTASVVVTP